METKLIDIHILSEMMMVTPKTLRKIIKEDTTFPNAISLGPRLTRWRQADVMAWIESKSGSIVDDV
jgi:predicted DNA-binding transcriptional regulator AlpA